jgi:glutamate formiminotransferase
MTSLLRLLASLFWLAVAVQSFAPASKFKASSPSITALQFGFLKELGLEKPSWLPDFGSKKQEPAADAEGTENEEAKDQAATDEE